MSDRDQCQCPLFLPEGSVWLRLLTLVTASVDTRWTCRKLSQVALNEYTYGILEASESLEHSFSRASIWIVEPHDISLQHLLINLPTASLASETT